MLVFSQPAHPFLRTAIALISAPLGFGAVLAIAIGIAGRWIRRKFGRWRQQARERKVRNWPTITATIEIPTVVEHRETDNKHYYLGTLTYFYRNPDLQMGDYQREFLTKPEARQWASQFKNRTVLVHVNPADATDSALLSSELQGLDTPLPRQIEIPQMVEMPLPEDGLQALGPGYRLMCGLAELVSLAGLATSAILLAASFVSRGQTRLDVFYWTAGPMLVCSGLAALMIRIHLSRTDAGRALLKNQSKWCPAWMRWSLKITGPAFAVGPPLLDLFRAVWSPLLHSWMKSIAVHVPYLLAGWFFFTMTAFLAAILRSQEDPRVLIDVG